MLRRRTRAATVAAAGAAAALVLAACGGGSGFGDGEGGGGGGEGGATAGGGRIDVLIGSSGDAETEAVQAALDAWTEETGTETRLQVASDLGQQLAQGFASGNPPDLFYVSTDFFAGYVANGSLFPYGDQLENVDDFYPTLAASFTVDDQLYCAPKDFSTLALQINTDLWTDAGLTEDDYPTTWEELRTVAEQLGEGDQAGLTFGPEWQRVGTFMVQAGGGLVDESLQPTADTPENVEALTFVKDMLTSGSLQYPSDIGAGWGGEAFGNGSAAMAIEGNWVVGALANDFPDTNYVVVPLPEGPGGPGTLQFTNCWGIAADSDNQEGAIELVQFLTSGEQQMEFSRAFGVMPSVQSVAGQWAEEFPEQKAFIDGAEHAQGFPPIQGINDVIGDFNAQIEGLRTGDPQQILGTVQSNLESIAQ